MPDEKKQEEEPEAPPEGEEIDQAAEELRLISDAENPALATYTGEDGNKSPGFAKFPPKPGLPTDADDAGRGGEEISPDNIVHKSI